MPDEPTESAPEVAEAQALPTPAVSQPSEVQQPSATADTDAIVLRLKEALLPELKQYVDRGTQSVKDRRIAGLEKKIEELASAKVALDAHGGDVHKAARDLAIDEWLTKGEQQPASGRSGEDWETGVQKILTEAEKTAGVKVPLDDPDLQAVAKGS